MRRSRLITTVCFAAVASPTSSRFLRQPAEIGHDFPMSRTICGLKKMDARSYWIAVKTLLDESPNQIDKAAVEREFHVVLEDRSDRASGQLSYYGVLGNDCGRVLGTLGVVTRKDAIIVSVSFSLENDFVNSIGPTVGDIVDIVRERGWHSTNSSSATGRFPSLSYSSRYVTARGLEVQFSPAAPSPESRLQSLSITAHR